MNLQLIARLRRMPRCTTAIVVALVLGQGAVLSPLFASELMGRAVTVAGWAGQAADAVRQRIPELPTRVNRRRPPAVAPDLRVAFAARPDAEAIGNARLFAVPLVPLGGEPSLADNAALARVLEAYAAEPDRRARTELLEDHLRAAPATPWRVALAANLGTLLWKQGFYSRGAQYWALAWDEGKGATTRKERAAAEYAVAELVTHHTTFGQLAALEARLAELAERPIGGVAGTSIEMAREGLLVLTRHHEMAVFSGPMALVGYLERTGRLNPQNRDAVAGYRPSHLGMSIAELQALAARAGAPMAMRHVTSVADLPVPSIVHLRSEHFATLVERRGNVFLVRDSALGGMITMGEEALQDEMSGYVLAPEGSTAGREVNDAEAQPIVGHCAAGLPGPDGPCNNPGCGGGGPGGAGGGAGGPGPGGGGGPGMGMPQYQLNPMSASVVLQDIPVRYDPPKGPAIEFRLRYTQRTARLAQVPTYGNVGPLWSHDWMAWVEDNVTWSGVPGHWANVVVRGDTYEQYSTYDGATNWRSRATLVKVAHDPPRYERTLPDGTLEVYTYPDRAANIDSRRVFLTEVVDPHGLSLTLTYDGQMRLVAVTDAIGQVTTLEYLDGAEPLRLTKVTDPFSRTAQIAYDSVGRIATLTDAIGMTSSMTYADDDFVQSLTTPYGTTSFRRGQDAVPGGPFRRIEATDPEGGTERIDYHFVPYSGSSATAPSGEVPTGYSSYNQGLDYYNSLYWDKRAMAEAPGDLSRATITHWLLHANMSYLTGGSTVARTIPHSVKRPLQRRVWYKYPNQPNHIQAGDGDRPSETAQVLESGTTQIRQAAYNSRGMVTSTTDPAGRATTYTYAGNGIDLLEVRQVNGGSTDLLASYANYTAHRPGTITDAAGEDTIVTYNAAGQPLTVTNAKSEVTTSAYDSDGYLQTVTGPVSGSTTTYGYDAVGRITSILEPDGYEIELEYDALNRLTTRTYPDSTYEQYTYLRLDLATTRDRKGRITRHFYDGLGRRTSTRDPLGRVVSQVWCTCGALDALIDANGNRTTWERDAQNRVTREVRADGTTDTLYAYDATGRLKTVTDPKNQVTTHVYGTDNSLTSTTYTNAVIATPGVTYTYETVYPRVATMVDGIGTTTYAYKAPGTLGAGQVASIDGPLTNDTIAYTYDELGRVTGRTIHGSANPVTWAFDALGRVTSEVNLLGTFTYGYDGVTNRLATVSYPNGQTSTYSYLPTNQDHRLETIHHKYPGGATLSKFDYTYDAVGNILTWRQQADSSAVVWKYGYDAADQLTAAVKESTATPATILSRNAYGYDPAGNRVFEQIDDQVVAASHDNLNRLLTHTPGGPLQFVGSVNETAAVKIDGQPAAVDSSNVFRGSGVTASGTTTVTVTATDPANNTATQQYEVDVTGTAKTFTYDANGNMTGDGARTFEWDARNQLLAISVGTHRSEFTYSGEQRRVRVVEKENDLTQTDTKVVWCDQQQTCEERAADGTTVTRRAFGEGEQLAGNPRFFAQEHLGSVTEIANASGTLLGRYSFDPWGRRTLTGGSEGTTTGFTGHRFGGVDDLLLAPFRIYDPRLGRWISEDPIGILDGPNMFLYVRNRPVDSIDTLGLQSCAVRCIRLLSALPMYFCDGGFANGCGCSNSLGIFMFRHPVAYFGFDINCEQFNCNQA